jgi:hypothetical protein
VDTRRASDPQSSGETLAPETALANVSNGGAAGLLIELQHSHGNAYVSRLAQTALIQRDPQTDAPIKVKKGSVLSPGEAVDLLQAKLWSATGLFDTMGKHLAHFEDDMRTQLGWYAGDKKKSSKEKEGMDAATAAASSAAKSKAKEVITSGVKVLAGLIPKVGGPAATGAGALADVLWKQFDKIADYDPVITEPARKKPHQQYIEALDKARVEGSRALQADFIANKDEMAAGGLEAIMGMMKTVDDGLATVDKRFYLDLVQGYRAIAPSKTVELETPHAKWSGEKRGLWGGGTYVTPIKSGTIYVEFSAKGSLPEEIKIERTIVPELPKDVMERFDETDSSLTLGDLVWTNPLVMEGDVMNGWEVRILKDSQSNLTWADSPSYSQQYLSAVASARGYTGSEDHYKFHTGAVNVYAKIITTPLNKAELST